MNLQTRKRITISLCMIVKNEEDCLERCLKSVHGYVDEMIIVDTGSTDQTVAIAQQYSAKIYHHPWEHDFSKHRNQSLSYATGDWIIQLDADEELFAADGPKIRATAMSGAADYYNCQFYDIKKDGAIHGIFNLIRLFRNRTGMYFSNKVHNQLQTKGTGAFCPIRIRHYGYDLDKEKMEAKHRRTTTLLQEMLTENPEDAYSRHQLAASYSMHREYEKAVAQGEMALAIMRRKGLKNEFFMTTYYTVAQGYYALENLAEAERVGLEALVYFPLQIDMCHMLAAIYFKKQSPDQCRAMSLRYLDLYDKYKNDPALIGTYYCHSLTKRNEIFFGLACLNFLEHDIKTADGFFQKSFEDSGRCLEKAISIAKFYSENQLDHKAVEWLRRIADTTLPHARGDAALADLGPLAYNVAAGCCRRQHWHLAEIALNLALQIDPSGFDHHLFDRLLHKYECSSRPT